LTSCLVRNSVNQRRKEQWAPHVIKEREDHGYNVLLDAFGHVLQQRHQNGNGCVPSRLYLRVLTSSASHQIKTHTCCRSVSSNTAPQGEVVPALYHPARRLTAHFMCSEFNDLRTLLPPKTSSFGIGVRPLTFTAVSSSRRRVT